MHPDKSFGNAQQRDHGDPKHQNSATLQHNLKAVMGKTDASVQSPECNIEAEEKRV